MSNGFPNVPAAPGVPPLSRPPGDPPALVSLLTTDAVFRVIGLFTPQWGIFLNGVPIITGRLAGGLFTTTADTVVSFGYKQDWRISDYPVEQGAFESYNKVHTPFLARMRFARGGSLFERQQLLDTVAAIAGDTNLYDAITPEEIYSSVNVEHYDYERTALNGVGIIVVEVSLRQVRVTATQAFTNTKTPDGAKQISNGVVQPGPSAPAGFTPG